MRALGSTLAQAKQPFIEAQQALKNTQNTIVIVGGGSVGIEYAGGQFQLVLQPLRRVHFRLELTSTRPLSLSSFLVSTEIISQYPKKSVTIIQSSNRLLSDAYPLKLSKKLQKDLESRGVRVVLGQRVEKDVANAGKGNVILKDGTIIDG